MKKFLVPFLIVTSVWLMDPLQLVLANNPEAVPPAGQNQTPAPELSQACKETLEKGKYKADPNNPLPEIEGDIIVLLTESIQSGGNDVSCSKIIECVRSEVRRASSNKNPSVLEKLEIELLKKEYRQCIIAGKTGLDLLNNYARLVYQWIAGIVGALCVLIIIVSGIQISIGGLSPDEVGSAKDRITNALVGLAVLFLSAFILYSINPIFFT